jgi:hypothetical protein
MQNIILKYVHKKAFAKSSEFMSIRGTTGFDYDAVLVVCVRHGRRAVWLHCENQLSLG